MRKIIIFLALSMLLSATAMAAPDSPEITAAPGQVNPYKTRSELLMDAAGYTGVLTPEQAASVWAQGLQNRSAAMQYVVMTERLRAEYDAQLDNLRSNWVTGMSSPWVQGYAITKVNKTDTACAEIEMEIETNSSTGPSESFCAKLWLIREDLFWRIDKIRTDAALYPYTLYRPES